MDEEIDEHVPSRFAEQIVSADKLSAQKAPPPYRVHVNYPNRQAADYLGGEFGNAQYSAIS